VELSANLLDAIVVAVYLLISLVLGVIGSRLLGLSNSKEDDYYLAGRKMPGWLNGLSNAATALNSDVAPLYCGVALAAGLSGAWFYLSRFGFGMLIISLLFAVKWRQMRVRTGPEFFSLRYGRGSKIARVYNSVFSVMLGMIPWIGAGMVGMDKVAAPIFGYDKLMANSLCLKLFGRTFEALNGVQIDSIWITVIVVLPLLTIYVWSSGLGGVLITDGLQGGVIIIGNLVLVIAVLAAFGGPAGMGKALESAYDGKDISELKSMVTKVEFIEYPAEGGIVQEARYPEAVSGFYGNKRNAAMEKFVPEYTGAKNGKIEVKPAIRQEGRFITATAFYTSDETRPKVLNGVPVKELDKMPEPKADIAARQKLIAEVSDNASYGENLSSSLPVPGNRILGPFAVLCWALICIVGVGGGVASDGQRYFSCKNNYEAAKVGLWGNVALFGMLLLLMLPVLGMLARYPEAHFITSSGDRESVYGRMLMEFLPQGAVGITVAAMLASVMSTVSTHLNYGSQTLLNDVYRPIFGEPKPGREVWLGRMLMLIIVAFSVVVSVMSESLLGITMIVVGLCGSQATFGWGQWWWYRVNIPGWFTAIATGPVFYLVFQKLLPLIPWWAQMQETDPETMEMVRAIAAMVASTGCWLAVTLLTKPEPMENLKEFYLRCRPAGYWAPVRRALIADGKLPDEPAESQLLPGFLIAIVGFVMMACGTLVVATVFVGHYGLCAAYFAATLVSGAIFKKLFRWHLKRIGADVDFYVLPEDTKA